MKGLFDRVLRHPELARNHGRVLPGRALVEDDGTGFAFAGKILQAEMDSTGRVPAIIRERVRLIQGELTIESKPGRGARIEILVSQVQLVT